MKKITQKEFIERANIIHKNQYIYTFVVYKGVRSRILIGCKKHKLFEQIAKDHLAGHGCPKCYGTKRKTNSQFINAAQKIHKNKYDYSLVNYLSAHKKVNIKCLIHGVFEQIARNHLRGKGCPRCSNKSISKIETLWLNSLKIPKKNRQTILEINNKKYKVDGFDSKTNTVYEFYGDFWHGNPKIYDKNEINSKTGTTFGELYKRTIKKEKILKKAGYKVISIWESDWINREK